MPCGHERATGNVEKVAKKGRCTLSKRSSDQNICNLLSKDHHVSVPALRNSEQRCIILTLVTPESDAWKILLPFLLLVHRSEQQNQLGLEAHTDLDDLKTLTAPPAIIFQIPKEQRINAPEYQGSTKSSSDCRSSGAYALGPSHCRSKRTKSVQNSSSTSLSSCLLSNSSSGSFCDGFNAISSDITIWNSSKADKPVKRSSRKKMKKKGKKYKISVHRRDSIVSETQCEESKCNVPVSETSISSDAVCPDEPISQRISEMAVSPCLSVQDTQNGSSKENSNDTNNSAAPMTCASSNDEMGYEPTVSMPHSKDTDIEISSDYSINSCESSEDIIDTDNSTERAQYSILASSSNYFHPLLYGKRGRLSRKMRGSSESVRRFSSATSLDLTGKGNCQFIWQKSQNNDMKKCVSELKNINVALLDSDLPSKDSEAQEMPDRSEWLKPKRKGRTRSHPCANTMAAKTSQINSNRAVSSGAGSRDRLCEATGRRLVCKFPEKLGKETSTVSKLGNLCSVEGLPIGIADMTKPSKVVVAKKEEFQSTMQATHPHCSRPGLGSPCRAEPRSPVVKATAKSGSCQLEPQQNQQLRLGETPLPGNTCDSIRDVSKDAAQEISSSLMESNFLEHIHIKTYSSHQVSNRDSQCVAMTTDNTQLDNAQLNNNFEPALRKCDTVGESEPALRKCDTVGESGLVSDTSQIVTYSILDGQVPDRLNSNRAEIELMSLNHHNLCTLDSDGITCFSPSSDDVVCSSPDVDELTNKFGCHSSIMQKNSGALDVKGGAFSCPDTDLCKILQVVDESQKLQAASEGIHLATGSLLAQFEKLLHSASPVLDQVNCVGSCKICCQNQLIGDALCVHQIPSVSLDSLWQWYEKPGSYGLEVKVEDYCNTKRSHSCFSEFRAYFVPYLSAVQLFGWPISRMCSRNGAFNGKVMETCSVDKKLKSLSHLGSLPFFSLLLPQALKEADACLANWSSSDKDKVCSKPPSSTHIIDGELLFEYFESDKPQQRRPFLEKIKELARGEKSFNCQIFGDPLNLECLNLLDLHPASWYSVAWYPIYRIPDGNLRAAFLTYHSLGHFVHRSSSSHLAGDVSGIVSPVVGMQCYNAKGECWFEPRCCSTPKMAQIEQTMLPDPSEILKKRLQTLEQAASVMSRASIRKGDMKSINRHPDYEFFVSRRQ